MQEVTNHPVHIVDKKGGLSPTSLVPFCSFSNNMSIMGTKIEQMDVPVCTSFRPKIVQDQLCYSLDPNPYKKYIDSGEELSISLVVDYNEERQFANKSKSIGSVDPMNLVSFGRAHEPKEDFIMLESIGTTLSLKIQCS